MQKITLYRYYHPDGGITVSTEKPDTDYTELYRLVADEGMTLTNGETCTICTDTDSPSSWTEIEDTGEPEEQIQKFWITAVFLFPGKRFFARVLRQAYALVFMIGLLFGVIVFSPFDDDEIIA